MVSKSFLNYIFVEEIMTQNGKNRPILNFRCRNEHRKSFSSQLAGLFFRRKPIELTPKFQILIIYYRQQLMVWNDIIGAEEGQEEPQSIEYCQALLSTIYLPQEIQLRLY